MSTTDTYIIDKTRIPGHIAIIMDGNGRWAKRCGKQRFEGHQQGAEAVRVIAEESARIGVKFLTLYTFSTENWNRPADEISALMKLFIESLKEDIFMKNNIRFRTIGDTSRLSADVLSTIKHCTECTANNTRMTLVIALSYSSRWEITQAVEEIINKTHASVDQANITEQTINQHLCTSFMPDPDLLIRTGGEYRLSNFLLWQCAYTELYFSPTFWPEFNAQELHKAIADYQQRERRFGKTSEQITQQ